MNLGIESETLEFKKTTGEVDKAMDNIASMLNKHGAHRDKGVFAAKGRSHTNQRDTGG